VFPSSLGGMPLPLALRVLTPTVAPDYPRHPIRTIVGKSQSDGYRVTLFWRISRNNFNLYAKPAYDITKAWTPVVRIARTP